MTSQVAVDVQIASNVGSVPDDDYIRLWMQQVFANSAGDGKIEISVRIVDEDESRELNCRYRQIDKATNVLSFPADDGGLPAGIGRPLGDIIICGPVIEREAIEQSKDVAGHWAHMLVHGALHLLGYDHESDEQAEVMESLEKKILAARGIEDPYH